MINNYLIRDFNDNYLKIDVDDVENRKGRFKYEKEIMGIDIDENNKGSFAEDVSRCASDFAHALVEKMKEEMK